MMGRRAWLAGLLGMTIPGMGGQVPPRPDQQQGGGGQGIPVAPGSTNIVRARQVIVSGTGEGVFVYSGQPAANNLIASVGQGGPDGKGNIMLPGVVAYDPVTSFGALACQIDNSAVLFYQAATEAGPWTEQSGISSTGGPQLAFVTNGGAGGGNIPQSSAGITTVAQVVNALVAAGVFS